MEKDSSVTLTFIVKHNINRSNLYSKIKKKYEPNETNKARTNTDVVKD